MENATYPIGPISVPNLDPFSNPGRVRNETSLKVTYGDSEAVVTANLDKVDFLGHPLLFNRCNGASVALKKVSENLLRLADTDPSVAEFLRPWITQSVAPSTFVWRKIKGTERLSAHSFGIAIDLYDPSCQLPAYWLWEVAKGSAQKSSLPFKTVLDQLSEDEIKAFQPNAVMKMPWAIVDCFEEQGFIWGGKWYYFDMMHFEYRPEFFAP